MKKKKKNNKPTEKELDDFFRKVILEAINKTVEIQSEGIDENDK